MNKMDTDRVTAEVLIQYPKAGWEKESLPCSADNKGPRTNLFTPV